MKRLVCEMCGGTDLVKQDGVFVCQNCGTKYSVEEAKKMMIEGTVKIDGTVKVEKTDFTIVAGKLSQGEAGGISCQGERVVKQGPPDYTAS